MSTDNPNDKPLFRLNTVPSIAVKILTASGIKTARVRYPSDAEWCRRAHRVRIIRRPVGRDLHEASATKQGEADLELLNAILVDKSVVFDEAEASQVIDRLDSCDAVAEFDGTEFVVTVTVPRLMAGLELVHVCRIPEALDVEVFKDAHLKMSFGRKFSESRIALEPAAELYRKVIVRTEGYAGDVPITHQLAVVTEIVNEYDRISADLAVEIPEA